MSSLSSLPLLVTRLLCCWQLALFGTSVWILIAGLSDRQRIRRALRTVFCVILCICNYFLFQCSISYLNQGLSDIRIIALVEGYAHLPVWMLLLLYSLLTITEIAMLLMLHRWQRTHITSASIKDTTENLPVGICAYERNGQVTLKNRTMERLCRSLTGNALLNGNEFAETLYREHSDLLEFAVELPEGSVWSFTSEQLQDEKNSFTLLIAYNVTEEYQKTRMLDEKRQTMEKLNARLTEYNRRVETVITEREILRAKVRIHDELGTGLLAIRHYLMNGGTEAERRNMMHRLQENIRFLEQEAADFEQDEYDLMLSTAQALGVTVRITGTLPEEQPDKHIVATAIHECFTNILRHTKGNTLFLEISETETQIIAEFTDDNREKVGDITEKGGLRSLRALTEQAGGQMRISDHPQYCLTITLPKNGHLRNGDTNGV